MAVVAGCKSQNTPPPQTSPSSATAATPSSTGATSNSSSARSGGQIITSAQSQRSSLESGKSSATTATTPPQTVPQGATAGNTQVKPPQPTGNSFQVWDIEGVDFDGDGVTEAGVAMLDSSNTLYVWWAEVSWWSDDELDGFLWLADQSAGFVLTLDDLVGLACTEADDSSAAAEGCIGCDITGDCEAVALGAVWNGGS